MGEKRKRGWWWRSRMKMLGIVLYVLSSGPMQLLLCEKRTTVRKYLDPEYADLGEITETAAHVNYGKWYPKLYAPVVWASCQAFGRPLLWYWDLFPVREAFTPP